MDYYSLINLRQEPFSNSPNPDLFFQSYQHVTCLQKLEIALRLRRGLSVVIGDIGTGKSTLSRQLVRRLHKEKSPIIIHLLLDPEFTSPLEFLSTIQKYFGLTPPANQTEWQGKEAIKEYLYQQGVDAETIPTLIIDEGQKLPDFCVEILREFLNYETNQHKLLQIIIFAQKEFQDILEAKKNFADRIATLIRLQPLNFKETREMINFRIDKCKQDGANLHLFSKPALAAIYLLTSGYPRKIVMLCSKVLIGMLIHDERRAGLVRVLTASKETSLHLKKQVRPIVWGTLLLFSFPLLFVLFNTVQQSTPIPTTKKPESALSKLSQKKATEKQQPQTKAPAPAHEQKRILGTLPVERHIPLSKMIARVYGRYTPQRLQAVLERNPKITNPNQIREKTSILFPVLEEKGSAGVAFLVHGATTFQAAYDFTKGYSARLPSVRIVVAEKEGKPVYQVVSEQRYADEKEAMQVLRSLPEHYQKGLIGPKGTL